MSGVLTPKVVTVLKNDSTVAGLVGNRIRPGRLEPGDELPALVYTKVSGVKLNSADGYSGQEKARIQIDCRAAKLSGAWTLARAVAAAMCAAGTFSCLMISDREAYEPGVDEHRVSIDFSIWNEEE